MFRYNYAVSHYLSNFNFNFDFPYAVNGSKGVRSDGIKTSSINLQSAKGRIAIAYRCVAIFFIWLYSIFWIHGNETCNSTPHLSFPLCSFFPLSLYPHVTPPLLLPIFSSPSPSLSPLAFLPFSTSPPSFPSFPFSSLPFPSFPYLTSPPIHSLLFPSLSGYTALHLAALDCPIRSAHRICYTLLLFGVDRSILSKDGTHINIIRSMNHTCSDFFFISYF